LLELLLELSAPKPYDELAALMRTGGMTMISLLTVTPASSRVSGSLL
jgi:hypothetical protein